MKKFFLVFMIVVIATGSFTAHALENRHPNTSTHTHDAPKNNGKNNFLTLASKLLGPAAVIIFIARYAYELFKGHKEPKPDPVEQRKHQEELGYQQELCRRLQEQRNNLISIANEYQQSATNYDFVPQNVMQARLTNLAEHAKQNPHQISTKTFLLSQSAQKIIVENCLPLHAYQTMTGSNLQHTIHAECLQVIDTIADTSTQQKNPLLISFVDLGREHNHAGMVTNAIAILDVCWSFIRSSTLAIGYGVFEGIQDTAETITHIITNPRSAVVDLATQVKNTAYGMAHCIKKYPALCSAVVLHGSEPLIDAAELLYAGNSLRLYYSMHPPTTESPVIPNKHDIEFVQSIKNTACCLVRFIKQHQSLYSLLQQDYQREQLMLTQGLGRITHALSLYCIDHPYDALKDSSRMATQCFLMHKSTHCLNKFFASAYQKVPAYIEKIKRGSKAVMAEELPVAVALQTTEAIAPAALQEELFVLEKVVQEEKVVGSVGTMVPVAQDLVTELTALLEEVKQELPQLKQWFDNTRKGFKECATKYLKIPYNHILGIEWIKTAKGIAKWFGFHHDFMGRIEKSGLVQFMNKIVHSNGFYTADVIINGIRQPKTFFPQHWSREKVISKILEAWDHFIETGAKNYKLNANGTYTVTGLIDEGINIRMYITKKGQITSAYPVLI